MGYTMYPSEKNPGGTRFVGIQEFDPDFNLPNAITKKVLASVLIKRTLKLKEVAELYYEKSKV